MLPQKINFEIVTPFQKVYAADALAVRLPGLYGYFGVYPGHTPFLAALRIGEIKVTIEKEIHYFSTSGGFVEVLPYNLSVLAETSEAATSVDIKRAQEARDRAIKRIKEGRKTWDVERAKAALLKAMNRIRVASGL